MVLELRVLREPVGFEAGGARSKVNCKLSDYYRIASLMISRVSVCFKMWVGFRSQTLAFVSFLRTAGCDRRHVLHSSSLHSALL